MSPSPAAASTLANLSSQLASAVERASQSLVAIHARRRIPSSGIIWRDGMIVSASHTVKLEDDIRVSLPSGESARATIVGRDPSTDLIVLRLKDGAHATERGDASVLQVGSLVLAVGRPGEKATASFGIVSAVGEGWRSWHTGGARIDRVLRLDLSVYDGFSGGALVDASGAVVGINNSALARGAAVALPADVVDKVVSELLERGHVRRPYVGVAVQPVALTSTDEGALLVISVADASPAAQAGVLIGDVLLEANGVRLQHPTDLLDAIWNSRGKPLALKAMRGGVSKTVTVTPTDRGEA